MRIPLRIATLSIVITAALSGCASIPASTDSEREQAKDDLVSCLKSNITRLDDKKSPADVVAYAAADQCREEALDYNIAVWTNERGAIHNPYILSALRDQAPKLARRFALQGVLYLRNGG